MPKERTKKRENSCQKKRNPPCACVPHTQFLLVRSSLILQLDNIKKKSSSNLLLLLDFSIFPTAAAANRRERENRIAELQRENERQFQLDSVTLSCNGTELSRNS